MCVSFACRDTTLFLCRSGGVNGSLSFRIQSGSDLTVFVPDLDPVSLENADPDLIVLITFKLTVGVCQNIRCNVQSVVACGRIRIWISKFKRFRTQISACRIRIGSEFFNM